MPCALESCNGVGLIIFPPDGLEKPELLPGPAPPSRLVELSGQGFAKGKKVPRIVGRVIQKAIGKRPPRPVGPLVLLGEFFVQVLFEERRQSDGGGTEKGGGGLGVEKTLNPNTEVSVEKSKIEIGAVHDHLDLGVFQDGPEDAGGVGAQRVEKEGLSGCGKLDQTEPVRVPMESGGFAVEGDSGL